MGKNIMIIEDDPFSHDFYKFIFNKAGFTPLILEDGDRIVEKLLQDEVDLIIMDINLKNTYLQGEKIDGVQLSRYIKQNEKLSKIPILLITAYTTTFRENKFLKESLAEDCINKPIINYNSLIDKVKLMVAN